MFTDRYGLPLSTTSQAAADHYVDALDRIFSFDIDAMPTLERAIEGDEGFALAHAVLAVQKQLQGDAAGATTSLDRAVERVAGASAREKAFVGIVASVVAGGGARGATAAIPRIELYLADYPRDNFLFAQAQMARLQSGAPDRKHQALAYAQRIAPHYGDDWAFNGSYAMVLQENDRFDESRAHAEISLRQRPKNANAIHPIAHCYFETNNDSEGESVLDKWLQTYEWQAPYHCHLSWHMALFCLGTGRYDRLQQIWDNDIAPVEKANTLLVDASSILWRLHLYDTKPASMDWSKVRPLAEAAIAQPGVSFYFSHAALYYAATGDEATFDRMVDSLRGLSEQEHSLVPAMTSFVLGLRAFSHGVYDEAATTMQPFVDDFPRFGGSNAQGEVYTETYIEACLRAKRYDWAEAAIRRRLERRPSTRDCFWLGRSLIGQDRSDEAAAAMEQAREKWLESGATTPELASIEALLASASA